MLLRTGAARGTSVRTEVTAGATTFLTMAYIAFVNPQILSSAGMPFDAVFVATCLAAALATLLMGLYANYPIALAPGIGLNAFFAFSVVLGLGHKWEVALGAVVMAVLFLACLFFAPLAGSIPPYATAAAILYVACLMARPLTDLDWSDITESAAAIMTVIAIPLTFSIADSIGLGVITYALIKLMAGRLGECTPTLLEVALLFVVKFAWL